MPAMAMPTQSNQIEVIASTWRSLLPGLESPQGGRRYEDLVFGLGDDSQEEDLIESHVDIYLYKLRSDRNIDIIQW